MLAAYAVSVLIATRILAGHLAWKYKSQLVEEPEFFDWLGGVSFGLLGGLVWPVLLAGRVIRGIETPAIGAEAQARERRRELETSRRREETEGHIAELEKNLEPPEPE